MEGGGHLFRVILFRVEDSNSLCVQALKMYRVLGSGCIWLILGVMVGKLSFLFIYNQ